MGERRMALALALIARGPTTADQQQAALDDLTARGNDAIDLTDDVREGIVLIEGISADGSPRRFDLSHLVYVTLGHWGHSYSIRVANEAHDVRYRVDTRTIASRCMATLKGMEQRGLIRRASRKRRRRWVLWELTEAGIDEARALIRRLTR